ncbi:hypothetical protein AB4156_01510 [Cupriavidus sp. 2MCAB6]|uniref:hypothetical protein n=1 Tax=Cupriavidus sp. 2MCAB6 TaxID=3232981 RepID=UPI003F8FC590
MTKESRTYFDDGLSAEVVGEILFGIAVCLRPAQDFLSLNAIHDSFLSVNVQPEPWL